MTYFTRHLRLDEESGDLSIRRMPDAELFDYVECGHADWPFWPECLGYEPAWFWPECLEAFRHFDSARPPQRPPLGLGKRQRPGEGRGEVNPMATRVQEPEINHATI